MNRQRARLAIVSRIASARSQYEVFAFQSRPVYPESWDPMTLRVLSTDGPVTVTTIMYNRKTVTDHWAAIYGLAVRVSNGNSPVLGTFRGAVIGGAELEYRPDVVRSRFAAGEFTLPAGPDDPAPWNPDETARNGGAVTLPETGNRP